MPSCLIVSTSLVFGLSSGFLNTGCTRANNSHVEKIKYLIKKNLFRLLNFIKHLLVSLIGISFLPEVILIDLWRE
jgi:hypothetical protein